MVSGPAAALSTPRVQTRTPGAPQNLTATVDGPSIIDLGWDAPSSNGGRTITGYEIDVSANGGRTWSPLATTSLTTFRHPGLPAGATRRYRVTATNANGLGAPAYVNAATLGAGTPGPPRALTADAEGSSVIELEWRNPLDPGDAAVTGYRDRGVGQRPHVECPGKQQPRYRLQPYRSLARDYALL